MNLPDRFKQAITAIFDEIFVERRFLAPALYRVKTATEGKLTAKPAEGARGLPPVLEIPIGGSILGGHSKTILKPGTTVLVMWIDGNPARPFLAGIYDDAEPLQTSVEGTVVTLNGSPASPGVARMGDPILAGPFPGVITLGSLTVKAGT